MNIRTTGVAALLLLVGMAIAGTALAEDGLQADIRLLVDGDAVATQNMTFRAGHPVEMIFDTAGQSYRLTMLATGVGDVRALKAGVYRAQRNDWLKLGEPTVNVRIGEPFSVRVGTAEPTYTLEGTLQSTAWDEAQRADAQHTTQQSGG